MIQRTLTAIGMAVTVACTGAPRPSGSRAIRIPADTADVGYSSDRTRVVVRLPTNGAEGALASDTAAVPAVALWLARADGTDAHQIVVGKRDGDYPQDTPLARRIVGLWHPRFAADGRHVFFLTPMGATTYALHVTDTSGQRERFVRTAADFDVIGRGPYAGCLLISDHTYNPRTQAMDYPHFVITPRGAQLMAVGDGMMPGDTAATHRVLREWKNQVQLPPDTTAGRCSE